jgi:hypothetical protein
MIVMANQAFIKTKEEREQIQIGIFSVTLLYSGYIQKKQPFY